MTVKKKLRLPEGWIELLVDLPTDGRPSRITCEEGFIKGFLEHPQGAGTNIFLENGAGLRVSNTAEDLFKQFEAQGVLFEEDDDGDPGEPVEEAPVPLGKGDKKRLRRAQRKARK